MATVEQIKKAKPTIMVDYNPGTQPKVQPLPNLKPGTPVKAQPLVATAQSTTATKPALTSTTTAKAPSEPSYAKHIQGFGSPEAYAAAIKQAQAAGRPLSDPAAAEAFKKDYPQLFGGGSPAVSQATGAQAGVPQGYVPVRSTLEGMGLKVDISPRGNVRVTNPQTGASYEWQPKTIVQGRSYESPEVLERITSQVLPSWEQVPYWTKTDWQSYQKQMQDQWNQYYTNQQNLINNYMGQISNYMKQYSDAGIAMLQQYQQQYSQALAQLQRLMQPDPEVPESVKVALDLLKKQTDENIQQLNEEMNRRGIYQSTIASREQRKLLESMTDSERQILADWLDQQHQRMTQAALAYAQAQMQFARDYAGMYGQVYQKPIEMGMQLTKDVYGMQSGLAQQQWQLQSDLAKTGFDLASQLRQWAAGQKQAWEVEQQKLAAERAKQEQELQKWQAEMQLNLAKLQEQQRHNIAMERRPVGGGGLTAYQAYRIGKEQATEEQAREVQKQIDTTAKKYGISRASAALVIGLESLKDGGEAVVRAEALSALKSDKYSGADQSEVDKVINSWFPESTSKSTQGWLSKIVNGLRNISGKFSLAW